MSVISDLIGGNRSLTIYFKILFDNLICLYVFTTDWMLYYSSVIYIFAHGSLSTVLSPTVDGLTSRRRFGRAASKGAVAGDSRPVQVDHRMVGIENPVVFP